MSKLPYCMDEQAPCIGTIKGGRQILFCGISRPPWLFPEIPGNFPRILKGTGIPAHPCYFAFFLQKKWGGGLPSNSAKFVPQRRREVRCWKYPQIYQDKLHLDPTNAQGLIWLNERAEWAKTFKSISRNESTLLIPCLWFIQRDSM